MAYGSWVTETLEEKIARRKKEDEEQLRFAQSVKLARAIRDYGSNPNGSRGGGAVGSSYPVIKPVIFVNKENPAGLIDGLNRTFILSHEPDALSEHVYLNGLLQDSDPNADYVIYKNVITFNEAPPVWSKVKCTYLLK